VLYDSTGPWGFLGDLYAQQTANLVSHFGPWQAQPASSYAAGQARAFDALVYLGSTYDEPLPAGFLADVKSAGKPVLWLGANIWQLTRGGEQAKRLGWSVQGYHPAPATAVAYKGVRFDRSALLEGGLPRVVVTDPRRVQVLASAVHPDGSTLPWAVRSGNFTYVAEVPLSYVSPDDRYLVFADLLFDLLAPRTPVRHRALVRLEDVGPDSDPAQLRACADVLAARGIPFTVACFPAYRDPLGAHHHGIPTSRELADAPGVVAALADLGQRGGTLIMHGATHQYGSSLNPYSAASADDFEFYRAHLAPGDDVVLDGPVAEDSQAWAEARLRSGLAAFRAAGFPAPSMFEAPHYAASVADYRAVQAVFGTRYDRGMVFPGLFAGTPPDYTRPTNQFFPYLVRDVYGSKVIPENLGNVAAVEYNHHAVRQPGDLLASAARNLAVRDGFASFFYHPMLGPEPLARIVDGLAAQGWTFVPAAEAGR
jgi:uncharacterized protein YdaL